MGVDVSGPWWRYGAGCSMGLGEGMGLGLEVVWHCTGTKLYKSECKSVHKLLP